MEITMAKKSTEEGIKNLKAQIKDNAQKSLYIFFGEEDFLKTHYFNMLKDSIIDDALADFNYIAFEGKNLDTDEIDQAIESFPMMSEKKLVLIKYSEAFKNNTALKDYFMTKFHNLPDYVCLVFYEENVDKRSVLYKSAVKVGEAVECDYLEGTALLNWIGRGVRQAGMSMDEKAMHHLIRSCDGGMNNIKLELEKLFAYCDKKITVSDIDRIVTKLPQSRVFDMINAVRDGDADTVFSLLGELKLLKEPSQGVMSLMLSNFERILHASVLLKKKMPPNIIASKIGVNPYFIRDYISAANSFSADTLRECVCAIGELNFNIRQGLIEDWHGIEMFLFDTMNAHKKASS